jgi:hypothetical protein
MQMISFPENQSGTFPATGVLALLFDATTTAPLNQTVIVEPVTLLAGEPAGPAHVLADFNFASFRTGSLSNIV